MAVGWPQDVRAGCAWKPQARARVVGGVVRPGLPASRCRGGSVGGLAAWSVRPEAAVRVCAVFGAGRRHGLLVPFCDGARKGQEAGWVIRKGQCRCSANGP